MDDQQGWPAVSVEQRAWRTNPDQRGPSGTRPNRTDRLLTSITVEVPQHIAPRRLALQQETVEACEAAARAIGSLQGRSGRLEGLSDLLARTEAVASSKIEHIYADVDDIARATIGGEAGEAARRTVAARDALRRLTASTDGGAPLTEAAILSAHGGLLADDRQEGSFAGRYREQQNWIGGSDFTPRNALHVPPPHELVGPLMTDLVAFGNRDDMGAIGQAAVLHAQFETIHPFTDGNGRVGRAVIAALLRRRGITQSITVPIAAAMLSDVDVYFGHLKAYREGDPDPIAAYVARSAVHAAEAAAESADRLAGLPARWHETAGARRGSSSYRLIESLLQDPIVDIARARQATGSTPIRTYEALDRLTSSGILDEITGGTRNRVWVAADVMAELSDLEERIGRRARLSRWT